MRNILVVHYSQSGQLTDIARSFAKPFEQNKDYSVDYLNLIPMVQYQFPWSGYRFFDAFPESVNRTPCEMEAYNVDVTKNYDLIVLAYQVWYMSPSIPFNSFLISDTAKELLNGKPVITIIGSRNMWLVAQEYVKNQIKNAGGKLVGNIALRDKAENLTGIITISYWMFSGKKDKFLGIFPKPGIADYDIQHTSRFGEICLNYMNRGSYDGLHEAFLREGAVQVNRYLISLEERGSKIFSIWAKFIAKKGGPGDKNRKARIRLFAFYLPTAIIILAPIIFVISSIVDLLNYKSIRKKKAQYLGVALSN